jgi:hypothetical protein
MADVRTNPGQTAAQSGRLQVRDENGNFLFHREWLNNYTIITGPGKWTLQVTSKPQPYFPDPAEGTNPRYIVNVKAILKDDLPAIKEVFAGREVIPAEELREFFLTGTIWMNDDGVEPETPMKGEEVECAIGFVPNRDGEEVLRITAMNVKAAQRGQKVNVDALFADDDVEFELDIDSEHKTESDA